MSIPEILTERLLLREWREEDIPPFIEINKDPEVMKYFPASLTAKASREFSGRIQNHFHAYGYGLWAVELLQTGAFIGFIGFSTPSFDADFTPCIEVGWRLAKAYWNRGYATEGAIACLAHGFDVIGFKEVVSFTSEINGSSRRVMEKIGLNFDREFDHPKIEKENPLCRHVLYTVAQEEWKKTGPKKPDLEN